MDYKLFNLLTYYYHDDNVFSFSLFICSAHLNAGVLNKMSKYTHDKVEKGLLTVARYSDNCNVYNTLQIVYPFIPRDRRPFVNKD